jgi:hypothetical protein
VKLLLDACVSGAELRSSLKVADMTWCGQASGSRILGTERSSIERTLRVSHFRRAGLAKDYEEVGRSPHRGQSVLLRHGRREWQGAQWSRARSRRVGTRVEPGPEAREEKRWDYKAELHDLLRARVHLLASFLQGGGKGPPPKWPVETVKQTLDATTRLYA